MKFHPALDTADFRRLTYFVRDLAEQNPEAFKASVEKCRKTAKRFAEERKAKKK